MKIKIMQAPDGKYYWVMLSNKNQVICRSERYERKLHALYTANIIRRNQRVELVDAAQAPKYIVGATKRIYGF